MKRDLRIAEVGVWVNPLAFDEEQRKILITVSVSLNLQIIKKQIVEKKLPVEKVV